MKTKPTDSIAQRNGWRQRLRRLRRPAWLGSLRRLSPLSDSWGFDRGTPVDRFYIEQFLERHRQDIHGRVLEIRDSTYTDRFGSAVVQRDVLDINRDNPHATIIADLAAATTIPDNQFDCFVLTQTLQFIYDVRGALGHIARILRPGGVLLLTVPSVSRVAPRYGLETDYWRFTTASCTTMLNEAFGTGQATVESYGNVLAGLAFLAGMAREELSSRELEAHDPFFPLLVAARAVKSGGP
jgi:SAM-dependent methyltransferase